MASIKRDDNKQSWESSDTEFPLVCETCLGDNPYVRMTKEPHGKKCQICENPFTVFGWQAGTKGRLKRVEICRNCAQAKNVCQVCIYDLQYGLPVKVRDRILREAGSGSAVAAIPQSNANRAWYTAQQQRAIESGQSTIGDANEYAHAKLREMARMEPRYERNLAKLCSFFARGECTRVANCPFRHEMPRDRDDPLSKQNTKDRFYGTSDPVANKILGRKRRIEEEQNKQQETEGYEKARATLFVRFPGDAPYPYISEMDIRDQFYSFGEIVNVRLLADKGQAFVEYTQPEATELAIASMNNKELANRQIQVFWARAPKRGEFKISKTDYNGDRESTTVSNDKTDSNKPTIIQPVAPPKGVPTKALPTGLIVKPPPHLAALAAARKKKALEQQGAQQSTGTKNPSGSTPYYPSADAKRLGT